MKKEVVFNFLKKENEIEMYEKITKRFIKNGYKSTNKIIYSYSFDCKETKTSNYPLTKENKARKYPYTIIIKLHNTSKKQLKLVA